MSLPGPSVTSWVHAPLALVAVAALLLTLAVVGDADATHGSGLARTADADDLEVSTSRIAGDDRYATAAEVARATFTAERTDTAVLASAADFPDALAGAGAAGVESAPVLLVGRNALPEATREALRDLDVARLVLVGGEATVSGTLEEALSTGYEVERLAGADRYGTAAAVAEHMADVASLGAISGDRAALLVSGESFPDALAAGPLSYSGRVPILLTGGDGLAEPTADVIESLGIARVLVVGGPSAVSERVEDELDELGVAVDRVAGPQRTGTAARLAGMLVNRWGYDRSAPILVSGDDFADALASAPRAGTIGAPVLLARDRTTLSSETAGWLDERCPEVLALEVVGGPAAIGSRVVGDAVDAAEACTRPEPLRTITYETGTRGQVDADVATFRRIAAEALGDERGWSLGGDIRFEEVDEGGDFRLWLASPQAVAGAAGVCSASWSCRVGDDVYVNDERWRSSTATFRGAARTLTEYRSYVVNHEVGHWLGHGHFSCPGQGRPAPVMQQQSIGLQGCEANVWPLPFERDMVRSWWLD